MKIALVTGANKGIGFETAKELAQLGYYVYMGCRDSERGKHAVAKLHEIELTHTEAVILDVTKPETITESRQYIEQQSNHLDILINNAGILGTVPQPPSTYAIDAIKTIFETNFYGAIRVTQEYLPLLRNAKAARIVNVSSGLGSLSLHCDPAWKYYTFKSLGYSVSKAALNGFTIMLAYELRDTDIKINSVDPEYTATDFNNHRGTRQPGQSAKVIVKYATLGGDGPTGKYFNEDGELPW